MSKGSKRPSWRVIERRYNYLTRQLRRAAFTVRCAACGSSRSTVTRDAELMADVQGFPVPSPICCEVEASRFAERPPLRRPVPPKCCRCHNRPGTFIVDTCTFELICRECITINDRWFCGVFPGGLSYADRSIEVDGDYKRIAFLPYSTLTLEIYDHNSPLIERIKADAAAMQARRGELFGISTCGKADAAAGWATGQTVRLGGRA